MEDDVAIKIEQVTKNFRLPHLRPNTIKSLVIRPFARPNVDEAQQVLKGIDLDIKKGEFFGVVGRNGSGKSTLLKLLAGIYQPTKGKINIKGKLVPFIELGVGFNPELTGRENIYLNGAILGFSNAEVDEMYPSIVEFSELERFMDQKLKNYSSGMQVRLAFSMAIRARADILLVDEVLAVGDADFQRKCFDYFKSLKRSETTVVFISHDMEAVKAFCDRAVLISDGKIIASGKPFDVAREYLRQFNKESDVKGDAKAQKTRWGSREITIDSFKVTKASGDHGDLTLTLKATAKVDVDNPVFGFMIKNTDEKELMGSNTELCDARVPKLDKGQKVEVTWKVPDIFGDGVFYVGATAHHQAGSPVYDWWEEAAKFHISEGRHSYYPVTPYFETKVRIAR